MNSSHAHPVLIRRATNPADAIAAVFQSAIGRIRREMRIRRDQNHLESMPDYILKDVGIHRSEVQAITRFGRTAYRAGRMG